jgi:hypothetical protein
MLHICAVQVGDYLGRGAEYVAKLFDGVRRNMPKGVEYRPVCFMDDNRLMPESVMRRVVRPGINGWWNKLQLFAPDAFERGDRVVYFDLDVLPVGDLSDIAGYRGRFAGMSDPFFPEHLNSSVMAWEAGAVDHIWTIWDAGGRPQFDKRGDQPWIEAMVPNADRWQAVLPSLGQIVSFKVDCWLQGKIPENARAVVFHGLPRPHEAKATFIEDIWRRPLLETAA